MSTARYVEALENEGSKQLVPRVLEFTAICIPVLLTLERYTYSETETNIVDLY